MQSSHIRDMPHEITGEIHCQNNKLNIIRFVCTCKAGASECCKHIVAVLLYLNRYIQPLVIHIRFLLVFIINDTTYSFLINSLENY